MKNTISIKKDDRIVLNDNLKTFLNPKYVFFKIEKNAKLKVKDGSYVYKNDIIMINKDGYTVHSSVSGIVLGIKDVDYVSGKQTSLVIENDFKENVRIRKSAKKTICDYKKEEVLNLFEDFSLTYKEEKLAKLFENDYETFIVNGIEKEIYFGNKYFTLQDNAYAILETIDFLSTIFNYKKCILVISNSDSKLVNRFLDIIGTYPNIELRLLQDVYPLGFSEYLQEYLGYTNALMIDVRKIVDVYEILKKNQPITEKIITISGDAVEPKECIKVKVGSLLSEVFINNFDFSYKSVDVFLNGLIHGKVINSLQYVIDEDIDGIIIMKSRNKCEDECLNCGLCHKKCPRGLNPKYVADHKGKVRSEYKSGCLSCGLCDYICPANRELMKYMKEVVNDEE